MTAVKESKLQERLDEARRAAAFLDDTRFRNACQTIRDRAQDAFRNSEQGEGGDLQRRTAHLRLVILEEIVTELLAVVDDGKYAQAELDNLRKSQKH